MTPLAAHQPIRLAASPWTSQRPLSAGSGLVGGDLSGTISLANPFSLNLQYCE